jgi:hypothetical protein
MTQQEYTNKSIIINWDWHDKLIYPNGEDFSDTWNTGKGHFLACTNIDNIKLLDIISMAKYYLQKGPVLIFLHKNTPHNSTEYDRLTLLENLRSSPYDIRVRLFGGGKEPIYYSGVSKGIVGIKGKDANKGIFPQTQKSKELITNSIQNFILNTEQKRINQEYFDHVWNAYWHTPKNSVYNLMEEFRFYTDGFDWTMDNADAKFLTHLADYKSLWHKLHSFAGVPIEDNQQPEYAIEAYMAHLQHTSGKVTLTLIENTRKEIVQIITGEITTGEMQTLVKKSYNNLYQCFKEIPLYL